MKRTVIAVLVVLAVTMVAAPALRADRHKDFQAIQKAVKQNPNYVEGQEVKWFKVLITDVKSGKEKVKITLPLSLIEALANCAGERSELKEHGCDIDLKTLLAEMKKAGPMALIEITDEDALIKVWLE